MLAINLLPIILMLIFTPKDAYIKWRPGITFIFVLSYISLFLNTLHTPLTLKGTLTKYDFIVIILVALWILTKPCSLLILKKFNLVEFDVVYRMIYLLLAWYYISFRHINLSFQFSLEWRLWLVTIIITIALILVSLFVVYKMRLYQLCFLGNIGIRKILIVTVYMFYFVALSQEFIFRGLVFTYFDQFFPGNFFAMLIGSSVLFGLVHWTYAGWKMVVVATIAGVGYGLAYHLTGNLFFPVISHTITNVFWKMCLRSSS
jgi:membrane protease YdiL (CAAX protease family)